MVYFSLDGNLLYLLYIYSHSIFAFSVKSFRRNIINGLHQISRVTYMYKESHYNYLDISVISIGPDQIISNRRFGLALWGSGYLGGLIYK